MSRCLRPQGCADTCEWVAVHANNGEAACVFHSTNGPIFIYKPTETDTLYQGVLYDPGSSPSTSLNTIESSDSEKTGSLWEVCLVSSNNPSCQAGDTATIVDPVKKTCSINPCYHRARVVGARVPAVYADRKPGAIWLDKEDDCASGVSK